MRLPPVADEPVDVGEREQPAHSDPDQRARPVYLEGIGGVHGGYSYRQAPTNFLKGGDPSCGARTFARSGDIDCISLLRHTEVMMTAALLVAAVQPAALPPAPELERALAPADARLFHAGARKSTRL